MWEEDFDQLSDTWETAGRENNVGPFKGRLGNKLVEYTTSTANLKLSIVVQPVGQRPLFFIDEPEHTLTIAQREGMTLDQAKILAEAILHRSAVQ